jgi:hypothetical protein
MMTCLVHGGEAMVQKRTWSKKIGRDYFSPKTKKGPFLAPAFEQLLFLDYYLMLRWTINLSMNLGEITDLVSISK